MSQGKLGGSSGGTNTAQGGGNDLMTFLFGDTFSGTHNNANTYNQPNTGGQQSSTMANLGNHLLANTLFAPTPQPSPYTPQQQAVYQQHPQWAPNYGTTQMQNTIQQSAQNYGLPVPQYGTTPARSVAHPTTGGTSIPGSGAFANRVGSSAGSAVGKGLFGGQGGQGQTPAGQTPGEQTPTGPGIGGVAYDEEGNLMPGYQLDENNNPVWTGQNEPTAPIAPTTPEVPTNPVAYDDNGNLMPGYQLDENNNPVWTGQYEPFQFDPTQFQYDPTQFQFDPNSFDSSGIDFSGGW
jgi:hypothetical protein